MSKAVDDTTGFPVNRDQTNPFRFEGSREPLQTNGIRIPWDRIPPIDRAICLELGKRASLMVQAQARANPGAHIVPPHPNICGMDFALVHLRRELDLNAFRLADDLTFYAEFFKIAQNVDRQAGTFPADVKLRFARS